MHRDSPPAPVAAMATQALLRLTEEFPSIVDPVRDLKITDMEFVQMKEEKEQFEAALEYYSCKRCPEFEQHVRLSCTAQHGFCTCHGLGSCGSRFFLNISLVYMEGYNSSYELACMYPETNYDMRCVGR